MSQECPYANDVGKLQARVLFLERELEKMQATAQVTANVLLEERAESKGYWRGVEIATRIVSAILIAGALMAAGKFTGALEFFLKIFKL